MRFEVSYYDDDHKALLKDMPGKAVFESLIVNKFDLPFEEFFVYSMFSEMKTTTAGWRNYAELAQKANRRKQEFEDYFEVGANNSLISKYSKSKDRRNSTTEMMGVGAALSLLSKISNITEADWEKIPVSKNKDLDFRIASTGRSFIEVEAKGAVVDKPEKLTEVSHCANQILKKKESRRSPPSQNQSTLYGVIASIPHDKSKFTHLRLLDPAPIDIEMSPQKYKLLARLKFYHREMLNIVNHSFLVALSERINAIERLEKYEAFDNVPLANEFGETFNIERKSLSKYSAIDEYGFGATIRTEESYIFIGMRFDVVDVLISQNFKDILDLKFPEENSRRIIKARIKSPLEERADEQVNSIRARSIRGQVYQLSSGRLISIIKA